MNGSWLELGAQAVWQFPTFSPAGCAPVRIALSPTSPCGSFRGRPRLPAHHRYPSFEWLLPNWRMIVIGVNGGMNCCLPSVDMGSSRTRNRITPFTPTIPARKSRNCTTSAVPIPPHVAIMLVGVTSTGTRPCRLGSRSHHRRAADDPTTGCCAPVSVKP